MKQRLIILLSLTGMLSFTSCNQELLDTNPTNEVSGDVIFSDANGAQVAINGIYRAMFINSWSANWYSENPGIMTLTLVKDLMGEDHLMANAGQGWFYYDYTFTTDGDFVTDSGRQYAQWNLFYTLVSQANYVIDAEATLTDLGTAGQDVLAQAYAIRAFSYFCLYEWFCQGNYAQNKTAPGIPIYTQATTATTIGRARSTVDSVFIQINKDFEKSIQLFQNAGTTQSHPSHIDLYAAYGLWARVAQVQEKWEDAYNYANEALKKPGLSRVATLDELGAFNNCRASNVLWGFEVIADQTGPYGPYTSHMDPEGGYGTPAPQCIDKWLYDQIPTTDGRCEWWNHPLNTNYNSELIDYCQLKHRYSNKSTYLADLIYLRSEEMILIAAEAACRLNQYSEAKNLLLELGEKRDTNYAIRLAKYSNSNNYNNDTHGSFETLMDEILFQRRIELWSEGMGRAYDLRRLNLGYNRDYAGTNHTAIMEMAAGDPRYVTLIPQKEFDSNDNMDAIKDQNPR